MSNLRLRLGLANLPLSLTQGSGAIASVQTLTFTFTFIVTRAVSTIAELFVFSCFRSLCCNRPSPGFYPV